MSLTRSELGKNAQKRASETLAKEGNREKLAAAVIVCASLTIVAWLISSLSVMVMEMLGVSEEYLYYPVTRITLIALIIFMVSPAYIGAYEMSLRMIEGENAELIDLFDSFSSARAYFRAVGLALKVFFNILPIIIALRVPVLLEYFSYWFIFYDNTVIIANACFVPVALLLVFFVCRKFGLVSFALLGKDQRLKATKKEARKARKGSYRAICALAYKTLFKLILSLLTLGVVTVIHTLPKAMLTYGAMASEMKQNMKFNSERTEI